jgi:DHA1 family bicyclomycin/chloramphenicol resistance-like MFS transporter
MTRKRYISLILILGSLTALAPFSIDMYLPGFPAIARDLHTSAAKVSLSLTGFFIGIAAGQLLYGPLLDRFGRKPPLYIGLIVYIAASIACAFIHSIDMLIGLRLIQALGGCAASVAATAMVRDMFPAKDNAKVFSLLVLVLGASPLVAPTIGGYVTAAFGWPLIFLILAAIGLGVLIAAVFGLPTTYKPDTTLSLKPLPMVQNFIAVLRVPQFYTYTLAGAIAFGGLFAYVAGSPLVFMSVFGVEGKVYGWIFAFLSIGFIGASQTNNLLLRKYSSETVVRTALCCYALIGTLFFVTAIAGSLTLSLTILFLFLLLVCIGIAGPNASSLSLSPFSERAGTAAALMGALQMGVGAFISFLISLAEKPSTVPMATAIGGAAVLALAVLFGGRRAIGKELVANTGMEAGGLH